MINPALLEVPSAFVTILGCFSCCVPIPNCIMVQMSMKLGVALLLSNPFSLVMCFAVSKEK